MFASRKSKANNRTRPCDLGMLTSSMGIALWRSKHGQQDSFDIRVGPAYQPRDGGSLVVRSTFPCMLFPEFCHGLRAAGEVLGGTPDILPEDVRQMLRTYAGALDSALNEVEKSPIPFKTVSNGHSGGLGLI